MNVRSGKIRSFEPVAVKKTVASGTKPASFETMPSGSVPFAKTAALPFELASLPEKNFGHRCLSLQPMNFEQRCLKIRKQMTSQLPSFQNLTPS